MYEDIKKYLTAYFSILMESKLNDVISSKNMISKPLSEKDLKELFETMDIIDLNNVNIEILYDPKTISESIHFNDILDVILKSKSGYILREDEILKNTDKKWHLFKKFSNLVKPFYIFKCSFTDFNEIRKILKTYSYADDDILDYYTHKFIDESENNNGVYFHTNNFKAICLNTNKSINRSLIVHEFTHYLQDVLNYDIVKLRKNFIFDENKIKYLNIDENDLEILKENFTSNDIMSYINEFIEYFVEIFNQFKIHLNIRQEEFIQYTIESLSNENIYESSFFKNYLNLTNDLMPLYIFVCCIIFNVNKKKIINKINSSIN